MSNLGNHPSATRTWSWLQQRSRRLTPSNRRSWKPCRLWGELNWIIQAVRERRSQECLVCGAVQRNHVWHHLQNTKGTYINTFGFDGPANKLAQKQFSSFLLGWILLHALMFCTVQRHVVAVVCPSAWARPSTGDLYQDVAHLGPQTAGDGHLCIPEESSQMIQWNWFSPIRGIRPDARRREDVFSSFCSVQWWPWGSAALLPSSVFIAQLLFSLPVQRQW